MKSKLLIISAAMIAGLLTGNALHHRIERLTRPLVCAVQTWQHPGARCSDGGRQLQPMKKIILPKDRTG